MPISISRRKQLVGFRNPFGNLHDSHPQFNLGEIIDRDFPAICCGSGRLPRGDCAAATRHVDSAGADSFVSSTAGSLLIFHLLHPFNRALVGARKNGAHFPKLRSQRQLSPGEVRQSRVS